MPIANCLAGDREVTKPRSLLGDSSMVILFVLTSTLLFPSMTMKLLGKTALVTGAARGIGRGCAMELARAGADVAINDREKTSQAEAVVAEIQGLGRRSVLVEGDAFQRAHARASSSGRSPVWVASTSWSATRPIHDGRISSTTIRRPSPR